MPLIRKGAGAEAAPPTGPDFERAVADLRMGDADIRWRAARALAAFPQAAELLGATAGIESDARVREAIFTSLVRIGSQDSVQALAPYIRSDDSALRTGAMDGLKAIPHGLPTVMAALLKDPDADVRLLACDLARELPSVEATALLSAVLDSDAEVNVCAAAIDVIADIGSADALPSLQRCADRFVSDPFLNFAIKVARDRIGAQAPERG